MTFSFSYSAIADVVEARIALRHHLHPDRPAFLTRDHGEAVGRLIDEAFAVSCLALLPHITDSSQDADTDTLTMEIDIGATAGTAPGEARIALEAAIAAYALHLAFESADAPFAARLLAEHTALIGRVRTLCPGASAPPLRSAWY